MNWMELAQDIYEWWALLNVVMKLRGPKIQTILLTSWTRLAYQKDSAKWSQTIVIRTGLALDINYE